MLWYRVNVSRRLKDDDQTRWTMKARLRAEFFNISSSHVARLKQIYRADFDAFGYDYDSSVV